VFEGKASQGQLNEEAWNKFRMGFRGEKG